MTEVESISGEEGDFDVTLKITPRYVNEKCTCCGKCADACGMEIDDPFNFGMNKIKAAYLPHDMAFPMRYIIDPALAEGDEAQKLKEACPYDAVDLDMEPKTIKLKVGAIIWATGWKPYDPINLETYGFETFPDVPQTEKRLKLLHLFSVQVPGMKTIFHSVQVYAVLHP